MSKHVGRPEKRRRLTGVTVKGRLAIISAFLALMVASTLYGRWVSGRPSAAEACATRCSTYGKTGTMVYSGPDTSKSAYKAMLSNCECR